MMAVIIFGGILGGVFTPTRSRRGCRSLRHHHWHVRIPAGQCEGVHRKAGGDGKISGMVLLLIGTAHTFSWVLSREQLPQTIANWMLSLGAAKRFT